MFAAFASTVHVRSGRVVPPGGEKAVPLWEAVVGAKVDRPERFLAALWTQGEGRLAYLYDTIGQLEPERAAFALGLWMNDPAARVSGLQMLATEWAASFRDWRVRTQPFARSAYDLSTALMRVSVDAAGRPRGPGGREFWSRVFESLEVPEDPQAFGPLRPRIVRSTPHGSLARCRLVTRARRSSTSSNLDSASVSLVTRPRPTCPTCSWRCGHTAPIAR